jgi:hypothetical protein
VYLKCKNGLIYKAEQSAMWCNIWRGIMREDLGSIRKNTWSIYSVYHIDRVRENVFLFSILDRDASLPLDNWYLPGRLYNDSNRPCFFHLGVVPKILTCLFVSPCTLMIFVNLYSWISIQAIWYHSLLPTLVTAYPFFKGNSIFLKNQSSDR